MIPTGISTGDISVLDTVSASVRNDAPRRNEQGSIILLSTPSIILNMWGMISPTNPIGPVTDITAPAESDVGDTEDSTFQRWLRGSGELKVMLSSEGLEAPKCARHPRRRIVAACTRCSALLCKRCLDRIDDEFVCAECVAKVAAQVTDPGSGGLTPWFKRLFGAG